MDRVSFFLHSTFRNFATMWRSYSALGRKNKRVCFVLLSFFRNFGFAEVTSTRKSKRKTCFPFAFLSFFRNFATTWRSYFVSEEKNKRVCFVLLSTFRNFAAESSATVCRWWKHERKVRAAQDTPLPKIEAVGDSRICQKKTTASAPSWARLRARSLRCGPGKGEKVV